MREHRGDGDVILRCKEIEHFRQFLLHEAHSVHTGVELYVEGILRDAVFRGLACHVAQHLHGVDFRFEAVGEHRAVIHYLRIHDDDRHRYAALPQFYTLVEHRNRQISSALRLQGLGYLVAAGAVAGGFHHGDESGAGGEVRPEIIEILDHGVEVHFEHGFMFPRLEHLGQPLETELRRTLDEDGLVLEIGGRE